MPAIPRRPLSSARHACAAGALALLGLMPAARAMDLLQGYRLALAQDARYQAARAANQAGQESLSQATAQLLPSVSISGFRAKASADTERDTVSAHDDYLSANYALQIRQPLYRRYNLAQYRQAKAQVTSADASLEKERETLVQRFASAYFEALLASDHLDLILAQKEAYAAQLDAAQRAFAAGIGTRTDIDDARARHDLVLADELEARQNVEYTRQQLQVMVHQPAERLAVLDPARMALSPPEPDGVDAWIARGEDSNPELRALRSGLEAARQEVEKAAAGHHPSVDLYAQRSKSQSESVTTLNTSYLTSQVGVQFNIPLFAGGYVNASVRQAEANLEKSRQEYEARRRELGLEIRKEFRSLSEGILRVRALEQAERSAAQAVYSSQKGFAAGTRTRVDILNSQQQLMTTRRDLAQARYRYILARVHLQSLAGAAGEAAIETVNAWLSESSK